MKSGLKKGLTGDDLDSYVDIFMYGFRSAALVEFLSGEVSLETVIARSDMPEAEFRRFAREHGTDISHRHFCAGSTNSSRVYSAEISGHSSTVDFPFHTWIALPTGTSRPAYNKMIPDRLVAWTKD